MEIPVSVFFRQDERLALLRRSDKLVEWLARPEYRNYADQSSTDKLVKLIDLIVWALEKSIPFKEWDAYQKEFIAAREIALELHATRAEMETCYQNAVTAVIKAAELYRKYWLKCLAA
ncbi:MAG: hypothetical protein V4649_07080 [Bacteroidota bacterium]